MSARSFLPLLLLLVAAPASAAGLLTPRDGSLPALEIKDHRVRVTIDNGFAITEVDQVFHNPHDRDLEALYTFPLPLRASLSELSLWIDGQEIVGEVVEREQAQALYEEQRTKGNDAALASKREYVAFDVRVTPVRAGADTRVRLVYLQPLEIDTGAGRYVYPLEEGNIDEDARAFWDLAPQVQGHFSFQCTLRSAYPIDAVRVTGWEDLAQVAQTAPDTWVATVDAQEGQASLDRDVVVYYRLAPNLPARVDLVAYRNGDDPGTFLVTITPGVDLRSITEGVDWTIVLDNSGSMEAKLVPATDAVARAIGEMRPDDRFRVIVFSRHARVLVDWTDVDTAGVEAARAALASLTTEGGTNLYAGLELGLADLDADRTSAVILVSDGGANVGPTEHRAFLALLARQDVRVFTFVMGQGANAPLLERLAEDSNGFSMAVSNRDDLYGRIVQAKGKLGREALHGVRLELDRVRIEDLAPARLPSAYHGQQIALFGRYDRPGATTLRLKARISGREESWQTDIVLPERDETHPELERLWAFGRTNDLARQLADGEQGARDEIVELGTRYSIVTDHTSMIVMREEELEARGIERRNRDRVATERAAREVRMQLPARDPRAEATSPMFGGQTSPGLGTGAEGPELLVLIGLALSVAWILRRRGA